ncbi:uncharacterized protein LOC129773919 [Toxorhynchites rutilus septentrionalis]|uniref:uncharacterized protein LOC129773919 n=1 Tax=Toxorhynchites rutilus septentrionalis TaxID=329112 RepID=UPI002478FC83|nr:uncharacterized protein LOC129773919 [Toxorhynchites rutilus septentrionalis]
MKRVSFQSRIPTGTRFSKNSRVSQVAEGSGCGADKDRFAGNLTKYANDQQAQPELELSNTAEKSNQEWLTDYVYPDVDWIADETPPPLVPSDKYQVACRMLRVPNYMLSRKTHDYMRQDYKRSLQN